MVYKIGLISTHGTGKTSLAALIEGELKRRGIKAKYFIEGSTKASERGLPINEETTYEAQMWILYNQARDELTYEKERKTPPNYDAIILDRTVLDNYCYLKYRFGEDQPALHLVLNHMQRFPYAKIYLLPVINPLLPPEKDGLRSTAHKFQLDIDQEIHHFVRQHEIKCEELPLPQETDAFRSEWLKIIVNQTLTDLNKPEEYFIK